MYSLLYVNYSLSTAVNQESCRHGQGTHGDLPGYRDILVLDLSGGYTEVFFNYDLLS